ncbi:hypothetical protein M9194_18170 [Vibrio sp. S4M6]|uniref:TadE/TadG family type IV pilus assembly protein n=1 Tax=Vibrio sinus TaxID=2946865 RepID=UPI00202A8767|nr:hypothetical protein [Vibrio sinus]MCL9783358.1 hypothetical protein [Vibrio sinus]
MSNSRKKQKGIASIIFVLMLAGMVALFPLATDAAHALQTRALLDDASEVASIAVAALNEPTNSQDSISLVTNYVDAYVPDQSPQSVPSVTVSRTNCQTKGVSCLAKFKSGYQYGVQVMVKEDSWFGNPKIGGFGRSYDVSSAAVSQKVMTSSSPVDVSLATDFSSSMQSKLPHGSVKIDVLKNTVSKIVDHLKIANSNHPPSLSTLGAAPYGAFTHTTPSDSKTICELTQAKSKSGTATVWNPDIQTTIRDMFKLKDKSYCNTNESRWYHDIPLTSELDKFVATFSKFSPVGSTVSWNGIIRAAQLLIKGHNPRRLLIIISDGQDYGYKDTQKLVNHGLCKNIRDKINSQKAFDGRKVTTGIFFVGFGYDPNLNAPLVDCVGKDHIFEVTKDEQLWKYIDSLVDNFAEETGHLR